MLGNRPQKGFPFKKKVLTRDVEYQMKLRGAVSDKGQLLTVLEQAYSQAISEADFYEILKKQGIELYSRNQKVVGAVLGRKFRFRTLGYDKYLLLELNRNPSLDKRLKMLKSVRENRQNQNRELPNGHERTRKRGI